MNITSRLVPLVVLAALILVPPPASAGDDKVTPQACPPTGCDPGDPGTTTHRSTLTVERAVGTVSSDTVNGHAIDCGSVCSVTDTQVTEELERPTEGWFSYTLSATGGPWGFSPVWSGAIGCTLGTTCVVRNDQPDRTVSVTWRDTTAPNVYFNATAVGPVQNYTVYASASDNAGIARFEWTVDNVARANTGNSLNLSGVSDGAHSVGVRVYDLSGNASSTVTRDVVVDRVAPELTIEDFPPFVTSAPTLTFASSESGVTHSCTAFLADVGGPNRPGCTSPWTLAPGQLAGAPASLTDGVYTLRLVSKDAAGNSTTTERTTTLDRVNPVLTIIQGPAEGSAVVADTTNMTFTLTEANPHLLTCTLDGAPVDGCLPDTPVTLSGLADGAHVFEVAAVDKAGHETTITRSFHRQRYSVPLAAPDLVATYGRAGVLWATGLGSATGTVQFATGARVLCAAVITSGGASCSGPTKLNAGRYDVTASYAGSGTHLPATDALVLTVRKAGTKVAASATPRTTVQGRRVRLTARVTPGTAAGTVVFRHGRAVLCRAPVRAGVASCPASARLRPDSYRVVAHYLGSRNHVAAKDVIRFRVTRR